MSRTPWWWIGGLIVALAACGGPIVEPSSSRPESAPRASASAISIEAKDRGWFQIELDFPDPQHLTGLRVRGGTLDGRTTIDTHHRFPPLGGGGALVRATPFHSEIRGARVLYGFFDGQDSQLTLGSLDTGATALVESTSDVIHSAAISDDGTVYYLRLDTKTREERGIFQWTVGKPPIVIVQPRGVSPAPVDASTLYVTPGGEFLLVHDCAFESCVLRIYVADTGEFVREYKTFARGLLGVFRDYAVAGAECVKAPCRAVRLAFRQDEATPFGTVCDRSRAVDLGGEVGVVTIKRPDCLGDGRDLAVDPFGGGSLAIGRQDFAGMDVVGIGAEPAVGSIVLATDGQLLGGAKGHILDIGAAVSRSFELK